MPQNLKIAVIGTSNTDMIVRVARIPEPGETLLGGEFLTAAGGKGANQAIGAARFANAEAALSVTRRGAQPSAPTRGQIDRLLARN